MNEDVTRQKRKGYILSVGAILILLIGIAVFQFYTFPAVGYLGLLVPVGILLFFGFRNISATRGGRSLKDERSIELHRKTGLDAFWIIISLIAVNELISVFPEEGQGLIYLVSGMASYFMIYIYYKNTN